MGQWEPFTLALTVGLFYLGLLRLVDVNEREPFWALGLLLLCGFTVGSQLRLVVGSRLLELTVWPAIAVREAAMVLALLLGLAILHGVARWRGWSEINGVMDGIVYGTAAGLGTSVGELFLRELDNRSIVAILTGPAPGMFPAAAALSGLALGAAGGFSGAALVGARDAVSTGKRLAWLVGGLGLAVALHFTIDWLAHGDVLSGEGAVLRARIALVLPGVALLGASIYAVRIERRAIAQTANVEVALGTASQSDVALLTRPVQRSLSYVRALTRGRLRQCRLQMSLHNHLVQLVLMRHRTERRPVGDSGTRRLQSEIEALRRSARQLHDDLAAEVART